MTLLLILFVLLNPFAGAVDDRAPESLRVKTFKSLVKLDDFPLYGMRFYGGKFFFRPGLGTRPD